MTAYAMNLHTNPTETAVLRGCANKSNSKKRRQLREPLVINIKYLFTVCPPTRIISRIPARDIRTKCHQFYSSFAWVFEPRAEYPREGGWGGLDTRGGGGLDTYLQSRPDPRSRT